MAYDFPDDVEELLRQTDAEIRASMLERYGSERAVDTIMELHRQLGRLMVDLAQERAHADRLAGKLERAFIKRDDAQFWRSVFEGVLSDHRKFRDRTQS